MAKSFTIIDGELYKHAVSGVLQLCIPILQGRELIRDIHAGVCGHHEAPHTLVGNAFRQGFYWPTAVADANEVVRTCKGCQFYARKTNLPAHACDIAAQGLIGLIRILIPTSCNFFSGSPSLKTPKSSVLGLERWVTDREVLLGCA
jgi:hypothetical protein